MGGCALIFQRMGRGERDPTHLETQTDRSHWTGPSRSTPLLVTMVVPIVPMATKAQADARAVAIPLVDPTAMTVAMVPPATAIVDVFSQRTAACGINALQTGGGCG